MAEHPCVPVDRIALAALAGVAGGVAAVDVVLIRTGHIPLSSAIRRSVSLRLVAVALAAHLVLTLPFDPLTWLCRRLQPKPSPNVRVLRARPLDLEGVPS
jgi:hypothetical protein